MMKAVLCCLLFLQANPDNRALTRAYAEYCKKIGVDNCSRGLHHYRTIELKRPLPVGAIIEKSDIDRQRGDFWSSEERGFATDLQQVLGHMVLKPIDAGSGILLSDISQ